MHFDNIWMILQQPTDFKLLLGCILSRKINTRFKYFHTDWLFVFVKCQISFSLHAITKFSYRFYQIFLLSLWNFILLTKNKILSICYRQDSMRRCLDHAAYLRFLWIMGKKTILPRIEIQECILQNNMCIIFVNWLLGEAGAKVRFDLAWLWKKRPSHLIILAFAFHTHLGHRLVSRGLLSCFGMKNWWWGLALDHWILWRGQKGLFDCLALPYHGQILLNLSLLEMVADALGLFRDLSWRP